MDDDYKTDLVGNYRENEANSQNEEMDVFSFNDLNFKCIFSKNVNDRIGILRDIISCFESGAKCYQLPKTVIGAIFDSIKNQESLELSMLSLEILNICLSQDEKQINLYFTPKICEDLHEIIHNSNDLDQICLCFLCVSSIAKGFEMVKDQLEYEFFISIVSRGFEIASSSDVPDNKRNTILAHCLQIIPVLSEISIPNEKFVEYINSIIPYLKDCLQVETLSSDTIVLISTFIEKKFELVSDIFNNQDFLTDIFDLIEDDPKINVNIMKLVHNLVLHNIYISPFVISSSFFSSFTVYDQSNTEEYLQEVYNVLGCLVDSFNKIKDDFEDQELITLAVNNIVDSWPNIVSSTLELLDNSFSEMKTKISKFICGLLQIGGQISAITLCGNNELIDKLVDAAEGSDKETALLVIKQLINLVSFKTETFTGQSFQKSNFFQPVFLSEEFQSKIDDLEEQFEDDEKFCAAVDVLRNAVIELSENPDEPINQIGLPEIQIDI
ncbi:hypothetical protein TVAG_237150 [Trichomonas vaginalis G3]|uniref:Uncharacterized protein n=1 Tax=Trichomonas vaginalis (strain ATCC PRA-98 / G3) TaxID=412133 RepID=A2DCR5_TRIV3|nr:armadillo (ARM) repeat-containing protein family [Trichomonas vaginalis G3]EAY21689.1 hypothetical protein TVAG_237150 [Trichomonas vaginalis G3]KAI5524331.1 armadillo (ARM) repeat-containing protein family [Trichomonas vaginalis G3]|eukprot:XP_001582675.1 hypothetical protein [Trichomonas vaginalis G3]